MTYLRFRRHGPVMPVPAGIRGPVQQPQFVALLRNEDPATGKRLTERMNTSRQEDGETVSNRQVGYGLVFGVPKSVSIYLAHDRIFHKNPLFLYCSYINNSICGGFFVPRLLPMPINDT
jgi:hypothetical protein